MRVGRITSNSAKKRLLVIRPTLIPATAQKRGAANGRNLSK